MLVPWMLLACRPDPTPTDAEPTGDTAPAGTAATGATGDTATTPPTTGETGTPPTGDTGTTGTPSGFACSGATPDYAADVEPILLACGGAESCHQLTLGRPGAAVPYLVDQPTTECADHRLRVAPGDPEDSYLIDKLTDRGNCFGDPMPKPLGGQWHPLSDPRIQTVYDWICTGALDR